jgi:hypothetical protein
MKELGSVSLYRGTQFSIMEPDKKDVEIIDIAHALSNICRFNGHSKFFYSVAQHSLAVWEMVHNAELGTLMELHALLHDAQEYLVFDLQTPFKACISGYKEIEARIERTIYEAYDMPLPTEEERAIIKEYDRKALYVEAKNLMMGYKSMSNVKVYEGVDYPIVRKDMEEVKTEYFWRFYSLFWEYGQAC